MTSPATGRVVAVPVTGLVAVLVTSLTAGGCHGARRAPSPTARSTAPRPPDLAALVTPAAATVCAPPAATSVPLPPALAHPDAVATLRAAAERATGTDRDRAAALYRFGLAAYLRGVSAEGEAQERRALTAPLAGSPGDALDDLLARASALAAADDRRALVAGARPALATLAAAARSTELVRRAAAQAAAGRGARGLVEVLAPAWGGDPGERALRVLASTGALYLGALDDAGAAAGVPPRELTAADLPRLLAAAAPDAGLDLALAGVAERAGLGNLGGLRLSDAAAVAAAGPSLCSAATSVAAAEVDGVSGASQTPMAGRSSPAAPGGPTGERGARSDRAVAGASLTGRGLATCGRHAAVLAVAGLASTPAFLGEVGLPAAPSVVTTRVLGRLLLARRDAAIVLAAVEGDARSEDPLTLLAFRLSEALGVEVEPGLAALLAAHVGPFWCAASRLEAELFAPALADRLTNAGGPRWWQSATASALLRDLARSPYLRSPDAAQAPVAGWVGGKPLADAAARDLLEAAPRKTP